MPVLPLVAESKRPAVKNGLHDATKNMTSLRRNFLENPGANYGVRTGGKPDIFVLDIDGSVGKRNLLGLIEKNGRLPKTVIVETGNGQHRYFRGDGRSIRNSAGKLGERVRY